jgi:exportin-2 (importin alpha re-exporter)
LQQRVDELLTGYPASPLPAGTTVQELSQSLLLLVELYHDLNCQDFPEYFEDHNALFMGDASLAAPSSPATYGLLGKYLRWEIPELMGEVSSMHRCSLRFNLFHVDLYHIQEDDDVGGPIQQIRAAICEIAELYALKYSDSFPQLSMFVEGVWRILSVVGLGTRDDQASAEFGSNIYTRIKH